MNWKAILALSAFGALMGTVSVFGYTQGIELSLWIIIAIISALILVQRVIQRLFLHSLSVGILDGIWVGIIQSLFFTTYMRNNPQMNEGFKEGAFQLTPEFVLLSSPVIGLVYGLFVGLVTWIVSKLLRRANASGPDTSGEVHDSRA